MSIRPTGSVPENGCVYIPGARGGGNYYIVGRQLPKRKKELHHGDGERGWKRCVRKSMQKFERGC